MSELSLLGKAKLQNLLAALKLQPITGAIAEVGVYKGGSLIELAMLKPQNIVYGFDTFEGLPKIYDGEDEKHRPGEFQSTFEDVLIDTMIFENIVLVKGLFPKTGYEKLPNEVYSFVHLDMDQWRGTLDALDYFFPRMTKNSMIVFDDYGWHKTPGIKPTVDRWARANNLQVNHIQPFQAFVRVNA